MILSRSPRLQRSSILSELHRQTFYIKLFGSINHLWLFGSVARDQARTDSDVDLVVDSRSACPLAAPRRT